MLRNIASLFFYARFLRAFSALGYRRAARDRAPLEPDFTGQTWLVSGATGGIGQAIALAATAGGARVLAIGRSEEKLEALKARSQAPERMIPVQADLSLIASVRELAEAAELSMAAIDVLVNNVGVLLNEHQLTSEHLETSFATNILGPFVLTEALKESGRLAADGIVINVSSGGMYGSPLRLEAMNATDPESFDGMAAYAMHKRAMVVLTGWWNDQWQGLPAVHVMHPGWVDTEGVQTALPGFRLALRRLLRNADQGADTVLWLAQQRPQPPEEGGIWLDRSLQPEHEFSFTRRSRHSAGDLVDYLKQVAG